MAMFPFLCSVLLPWLWSGKISLLLLLQGDLIFKKLF